MPIDSRTVGFRRGGVASSPLRAEYDAGPVSPPDAPAGKLRTARHAGGDRDTATGLLVGLGVSLLLWAALVFLLV